MLHVQALAAVHELKERWVHPRELNIASADGFEAPAWRVRPTNAGLHRGSNPLEADRGKLAQEPRNVTEVILLGGVRYARFAGGCASRQRLDAVTLEDAFGRLQQGFAQGAMMIAGRALAHRAFLARFGRNLCTPTSHGEVMPSCFSMESI
jgi:hypothetical protein